MFTEEMVEYTYGVMTENEDVFHIDFAIEMTFVEFGFDSEDYNLISEYHKFYDVKSEEIFG